MPFKINFEMSDSENSDENIIPPTPTKNSGKSSLQKRREEIREKLRRKSAHQMKRQQRPNKPSASSTPISLTTSPPTFKRVPHRTLVLQNGKSVRIYKGFNKLNNIHTVECDEDPANDYGMSRIFVNLNTLKGVLENEMTDFHIWYGINQAIYELLPIQDKKGMPTKSMEAWRGYKMYLSRSTRQVSLYRLYQALQIMGNEFSDLTPVCNKVIKMVFNELFMTKWTPLGKNWRMASEVLEQKPPKFEVNGTTFKQTN